MLAVHRVASVNMNNLCVHERERERERRREGDKRRESVSSEVLTILWTELLHTVAS